jgi:protein HIRA/HIR1
MRVIKPHWCLHSDDKERPVSIFTLSLHPDGTRLATGGLDTKIKVWSTAPVLDEEKEMDEALPKLLSTLTAHSGKSRSRLSPRRGYAADDGRGCRSRHVY